MKIKNKIAIVISFLIFIFSLSACSAFAVPSHNLRFYDTDGETLLLEGDFRMASLVNLSLLSEKVALKEGYELEGFFTENGVKFDKQLKLEKEMSFTAKIAPIVYNITYKSDIPFENDNITSYTIESETFTLNDPHSDSSLQFAGWTTPYGGAPKKQISVQKGSVGDLCFTARWHEKDKFYLYFDTDGAGEIEPMRSDSGIYAQLPDLERKGYEFDGWYKNGELYSPAVSYVSTEKTDLLYAAWRLEEYTITFIDCDCENIIYTVESDNITLKPPYRQGYEFLGFVFEGQSVPEKNIVIKKGTVGNFVFTAVWEPETIVISFDTSGGNEIPDMVVKCGDRIYAPKEPVKPDCTFTGWYLDPLCTRPFDFSVVNIAPTENLTLYAGWYSEKNYVLTYNSENAAELEGSRASGSRVMAGESVTLTAPQTIYGGIFKNWTAQYGSVSEVWSYDSEITFDMPANDITLSAVYRHIEAYTYTSGDEKLDIARNKIEKILGNGITPDDYDEYSVSGEFLTSLGNGTYIFACLDGVWQTYMIKVVGEDKLSKAELNYDINYPSVTLIFDEVEGKSYEYSFNSSPYTDCESGLIITDYDKTRRNEIIIRNKDDYSDKITLVKQSSLLGGEYYDKTFSLNGVINDYVLESKREFIDFAQYVIYVGALDEKNKVISAKYPYGVSSVSAYIAEPFEEEFSANYEEYCNYVFDYKCGAAYYPQYSYKYNSSTNIFTYTIYLRTDTPNMLESGQQANLPINGEGLLVDYSAENANYEFAADGYEKTQLIRTIYELEGLAYGVKPLFDENSDEIAKITYEAAKAAIKKYTSPKMNDFELVTAIYDYLASTVTYDDAVVSAINISDIGKYSAFTSYGAIVKGFAVCDGLSSAFDIMCSLVGIESYEITGRSEGGVGGHAWNKVRIYGNWYGVDPTWSYINIASENGDTEKYVYHKNFLISEGELYEGGHRESAVEGADGSVTEGVVFIAAAGSVDYYQAEILNGLSYYASSGDKLEKIINAVASRGGKTAEVMFTGNSQNFTNIINYVNRPFGKYTVYAYSLAYSREDGSRIYIIFFK